jgi:hypothetical protein
MSHFRWSLVGIVLIAILAVFAVSAPAYAQTGTGPDDGLNFGVWRSLDFNAEQWMCFDYKGDDSPVTLDVFVVPGNSVDVRIRTPENIELWRSTGQDQCIGCGTADPAADGDLHWDGSFNIKGQYCVTVKHNRSRADAAYYKAVIMGDGVSFPEPAPLAEAAGTRGMAEPAAPAPVPSAADSRNMMGTGPDFAMVPGNWTELGFNATHWYVFRVDDPAADVKIELFVDGDANAANFRVRMPEDVQVWRDTGENPCIGCGTDDEFVQGDRSWRGVFNTKGLVWVTVHSTRMVEGSTYYRLVVDGSDLSFPTLTAPAVAEPTTDAATRATVAPPAAEAAPAAAMAGDGPDTALAPDGQWRKIESGEQHWYLLPIKKNKDIEVSIFGSPADAAMFTIRTADQVDLWRRTGEEPCIGCGTVNDVAKGDLFWTGMFNQNGNIWIVVESLNRHDGAAGFYRIVAEGAGVDM